MTFSLQLESACKEDVFSYIIIIAIIINIIIIIIIIIPMEETLRRKIARDEKFLHKWQVYFNSSISV